MIPNPAVATSCPNPQRMRASNESVSYILLAIVIASSRANNHFGSKAFEIWNGYQAIIIYHLKRRTDEQSRRAER